MKNFERDFNILNSWREGQVCEKSDFPSKIGTVGSSGILSKLWDTSSFDGS